MGGKQAKYNALYRYISDLGLMILCPDYIKKNHIQSELTIHYELLG